MKKGKNYPETVEVAYNLLMTTKVKMQNQAKIGVSFAQLNEASIPEWKKEIKCHNCGKFGHFKN